MYIPRDPDLVLQLYQPLGGRCTDESPGPHYTVAEVKLLGFELMLLRICVSQTLY